MKDRLSSLDLLFIVRELCEKLIGSKLQAVKQQQTAGQANFLFEFYNAATKEKIFLKFIMGRAIYITTTPQQATEPSSFCMLLRKHLEGKVIVSLRQHEFDRIIEIDLATHKIIFELFSTGNLILLDDHNTIIDAYNRQRWRDRYVQPKKLYKYPPTGINPFKHDFIEFQKIFRSIDKPIVKILATDFGLGGTYAEEICSRLALDKNKPAAAMTQQEADKLHRFFEQVADITPKPAVIRALDTSVSDTADVVPFDMVSYAECKSVQHSSFNLAVEAYFEVTEKATSAQKEIHREQKEAEKIHNIIKSQAAQLQQLQATEEKCRQAAQLLYEHYEVVSNVLATLMHLKDQGKQWSEIEKIHREQHKDHVKQLRPDEAIIVLNIAGTSIELDFRKTIEQNAGSYFEQAKAAKGKIAGLQGAMKKFAAMEKPAAASSEEKIVVIEEKSKIAKPKVATPEKKIRKTKISVSKKWYERYHWFVSSDGLLVVAGKNARNNETIIKRYVRPQDLVLHADIHGSPFAVIRNDAKLAKLPAVTIYEAAELVATYSRAWDEKLANIAVYYVTPDQVKKMPGLPAGSFQIQDKRGWLEKIKPRLSIGMQELRDEQGNFSAKLISGPPTAVKKQTPYMITIVPGDTDAKQLAAEIKRQLVAKVSYEIKHDTESIDEEEIKKIIPYGKGQLVV